MRRIVIVLISAIAMLVATASTFAQVSPMKRMRYELTSNEVQVIQGANGTQYYKCTILNDRLAPGLWVEVVHYQGRGKDFATRLHPAFDSANNVWTDVITVYDKRIEWISAEDLTGQQVMVFFLNTDLIR